MADSEIDDAFRTLENLLLTASNRSLPVDTAGYDHVMSQICHLILSHQMTLGNMLRIQDLFVVLQHECSMYTETMIQYLSTHTDWLNSQLTPLLFLQLSLYIGIFRDAHPILLTHMEQYLSEHVVEFSGRELGVVCHCFFAVNRSIRNYDTLRQIAWTTYGELESMTISHVANVLKGKYTCIDNNIIVNM